MISCGIVSVEDNKTDALVIKRTLKQLTHENVTILKDGKEALNFFNDSTKTPCLIMLDINLPLYNGLELLEKIRNIEHLRYTPIIIFSSSHLDEEIKEAYKLGANCYVAKPSSHEKLEDSIKEIYKFWFNIAKITNN